MEQPKVSIGNWITIKSNNIFGGIDAYVFNVSPDGELSVGYYQNNQKAIKEDVVWKDGCWQFKYSGPNGAYLTGNDAGIVKNGPPNKI